jgi:hypothetical protein
MSGKASPITPAGVVRTLGAALCAAAAAAAYAQTYPSKAVRASRPAHFRRGLRRHAAHRGRALQAERLFPPAATPREVVTKLYTDSAAALNVAEVKEKMATQGLFVVASAPEPFAAFVKSEIPRWQKVVKDSGVKPQ